MVFPIKRFTTAVVLLLLAGVGSWMAGDYLWFEVSNPTIASLVYLGWVALLLVSAWAVSGIFVALRYPAGGSRPKESSFRFFRPVETYRSFVMLGLCIVEMVAAHRLSGGALFEYKTVQLEVRSRSEDPADLLELFSRIVEMQNPEDVTRFVQKLPLFFEHRDEKVREAALEGMAVMAHRMNLSVYLLEHEGILLQDRWEPEVVLWMRNEVLPKLSELYAKKVTPLRAVVRAAAWIIEPEALEWFISLVQDPRTPDAVFVEAAAGIGNIGQLEGAEALAAAIPDRRGESLVWLFRGLQRVGQSLEVDDTEGIDERVLALLNKVLDEAMKLDDTGLCAALVAIGGFQHSGLTSRLIDLFESERSRGECPRLEVKEPATPPLVFVKQEGMRWLLLKIFADIGAGNSELASWVKRAVERSQYNEELMRGLLQLHSSLSREKVLQ